jgi:hypothetical protein
MAGMIFLFRRLTDEHTATYVHRLTDECTIPIFVGFLCLHRFQYRGT